MGNYFFQMEITLRELEEVEEVESVDRFDGHRGLRKSINVFLF